MNVDIELLLFAAPVILVAIVLVVPILAFNIWVFSDRRVGFWRAFSRTLAFWGILAAGTVGVGTYHVNSTQPQEIAAHRAPQVFSVINSASTDSSGWTMSEFMFSDIQAGENDFKSQEVQDALNSGQTVQLKTSTKKPAEIRLVSITDKVLQAVVTYDGTQIQDKRLIFNEYQPKSYVLFPLLSDPAPLPKV